MDTLATIRAGYRPIQPTVRQSGGAVTYVEWLPDDRLQSYVYCYWELRTQVPLQESFTYRVVADGCIDIFFELSQPSESFVMGFCRQYTEFALDPVFRYVGIRFLKLNAGIVTEKLAETKQFYTETLGFGVTFENEFYLLLHTPGHTAEISFLLPDHPTQQPLFQPAFQGAGVYLTIEVEDVDEVYASLREKGVPILVELRDEPWGDRHFAIRDPNGVGIDIVTYAALEQ